MFHQIYSKIICRNGNALIEITEASDRFLEILREQSSQAYETLSGQWEENIQKKEQETLSMLIRLAGIVDNYIEDMTDFIAPENESELMRVDRNDIWWNYEQISVRATDFLDILGIMNSSWKDYKRIHIYNPFLSPAENELKKAELEAAEREEREKRERNYRKLEEFQRTLWRKIPGVLTEEVENIRRIYEDSVVPFENTDDEYKKIVAEEYDELAGLIDRMDDVSYVIGDYMNGAIAGMKEFVEGMWGLSGAAKKLIEWGGRKGLNLTVPETLEEDVAEIFKAGEKIISDPWNTLGAIGQGMADMADEKGVAYFSGHLTADIAIVIAMDKGVGKLKELLKSGRLSISDALTKWTKRVKSKIKGRGAGTPKTIPQQLAREGKTPVIGKMRDLNTTGNVVDGEFRIADYLPDMGNPKANWHQNSGILRSVMNEGVPIKDISMFPMDKAGFLGAERNLLQSKGWTYFEGYWYPPK